MRKRMKKKKLMRQGKRSLACIMAAALAFSAIPGGLSVTVRAEAAEVTVLASIPDGITVSGTEITSAENFTGTELDLTGTGITSIGKSAFRNNKTLTKVILPSTLTSIGEQAFQLCSALTQVTFEQDSQLASIGDIAFGSCSMLTRVTFEPCSGLTTIGTSAFNSCSALTQVTFGSDSQLTTIGEKAFHKCSALASFSLPDTVKTLGERAFYGCESMRSFTIGEDSQMTSIGTTAFQGCKVLTSFSLPDAVETIESNTFCACNSLANFVTGESSKLTTIDSNAFQNCTALTAFSLPDTVTAIGQSAFTGCSGLTTFTIGEGSQLKSIGINAFNGANALTGRISFPVSLTTIDRGAFTTGNPLIVEFKNSNTTLVATTSKAFSSSNVIFSSEPDGSVETYARSNGHIFWRPASASSFKVTSGTEALEFYYGGTINAAVLREKGVTASAEFVTDPGKQGDVDLSDCVLSGFSTERVGSQNITFTYSDQTATLPITVYYDLSKASTSSISNQTYTGEEIKPDCLLTLTAGTTKLNLQKDKDYTETWKNNVNVGTATLTLTGKGNYKGTKETTFSIQAKPVSDEMQVELEKDTFLYTGKGIEPEVSVSVGEQKLVQGQDYTVQYADNVDLGTGSITVTAKGNYSGRASKTFRIVQDLKEADLTLSNAGLVYTGKALTPEIVVTLDGTILTEDEDYTVRYKNNMMAGENSASVIVTGKGLYTGSLEKKFTIQPKDIQDVIAAVLDVESLPYTGEALEPKVTVTMEQDSGTVTLIEGTDYTVEYADNVDPGKASVTITAQGNYQAVVVLDFTITEAGATATPPAPTEPAPTEPSPTEPAPTEPAPTEPAPTEPAPTEPASTEPASTAPASTAPTPMEPAQPTETPKSGTDPADGDDSQEEIAKAKKQQVKSLKIKNKKPRSVVLTWKKVPGASEYQIQYSTSKKFKGKSTKLTGKTKITLKKLKSKKTYYFRIRTCTTAKNKKVYGAWSTVKKIKIK